MRLNERVLQVIKEKGLKQNTVPEKLGKNPNIFNGSLHNGKKFDDRDIVPLCEVLGITHNELFGFNTSANDASAASEVSYMTNNNNEVSFHYAVDDIEAIEAIPTNRNAWHAGDGNGPGNHTSIAVEICYSEDGGELYEKAENNAVELVAQLLQKHGLGIDKVKQHNHWSGKNCPHRIRQEGTWGDFLDRVEAAMGDSSESALKEWQDDYDLTVDGIYGLKSRAKMQEMLDCEVSTSEQRSNLNKQRQLIECMRMVNGTDGLQDTTIRIQMDTLE